MKLSVRREQLNEAPEAFLHHSGWALIHDRRRGVSSFVKRFGTGHYPRLHLYVDEQGGQVIFNMHLDQKEASYAGAHMHNAEYDNELVAAEITSIKMALGMGDGVRQTNNQAPTKPSSSENISITKPQYNQNNFVADLAEIKNAKPKTFWQKLLGL